MENIESDDAAYISFVRSTSARAKITSIDTGAALEQPGVIAVVTAADVDLEPFPSPIPANNQQMLRPWIADKAVRYVGEIVAIVVSDTLKQGIDAGEFVVVEYDDLDPVVSPEDAVTDVVLVDEKALTNISLELTTGGDESLFDDCEVVVKQRIVNNRVAPCPIESRGAISR